MEIKNRMIERSMAGPQDGGNGQSDGGVGRAICFILLSSKRHDVLTTLITCAHVYVSILSQILKNIMFVLGAWCHHGRRTGKVGRLRGHLVPQ